MDTIKHFVSFDTQDAYTHFCEVTVLPLTPVEAYPEPNAYPTPYFHAEFWSDRKLTSEEVSEIRGSVGVIVEECNVE